MTEALEELQGDVLGYCNYVFEVGRAQSQGFPPPEPVEQPYYLWLAWQLKKTGLSYRAGGYEDQPHLVMRAIDVAFGAEEISRRSRGQPV